MKEKIVLRKSKKRFQKTVDKQMRICYTKQVASREDDEEPRQLNNVRNFELET